MEQKSKILNILEKTTFHVEQTPKNVPWLTTLLVIAKNSLFMVVIFAVFSCFTWNQPGFLALYCVFLVILSRQNTCLPVFFWLFHVKHQVFFSVEHSDDGAAERIRGDAHQRKAGVFHVKHRVFFSVLCNFFDCRLVFVCFCCVFGLIWLIINGFCCFFLVSRETCRFHSRFLLFCGNFCSLCCVFLFRLVYLGLFFGIKWILLRFCF